MKKIILILAMITLFGCSKDDDKTEPIQEQKTCYVCSLLNSDGQGFTTKKECRTDEEQQEFLDRVQREGYHVVKCDKV